MPPRALAFVAVAAFVAFAALVALATGPLTLPPLILMILASVMLPSTSCAVPTPPSAIPNVTLPLVPPPVKPTPGVTPVIVPPPNDNIPPGLEAIILKALSKKPEQRYSAMTDVIEDLDRLDRGEMPLAVSEMIARSGSFNVPADYFSNGPDQLFKMGRPR